MAKLKESEFTNRIKSLVGDEYVFLDKYDGAETKIRVKHNVCGTVRLVTPHAFTKGPSCPTCSVKKPKLTEDVFRQRVLDEVGEEYNFLECYVNMRTKIKVVHNKCGSQYKVAPHMFFKGTRCPQCNSSKGESYISTFLTELGIDYEREYRFPDCRYKYTLPFDFALVDEGNVYAVIEYHGKQHYYPNEFFGGDDGFIGVKERDRIKENYCVDNGIKYIEIPYILTKEQINATIVHFVSLSSLSAQSYKKEVVHIG